MRLFRTEAFAPEIVGFELQMRLKLLGTKS
jgi:hypothetical protein